jgi:hypothetical protein
MEKIKITVILFIFLSSFLSANNIKWEDSSEKRNSYWLGLGIGNSYFGPNLCANISFTINQNLLTIKYSKSDEFRFNVEGHYDDPALTMKEIGILYGRFYRESILLLSASIGVSYLNGVNRGRNIQYNDFEKINISTIGFPFEVETMFEFTDYAGIGIIFYGNINKEKIFTGGMLRIKLGWF